jgi:hypothetical protein
MIKSIRKPVMVFCVAAIFIGGAAVSYASLKERNSTEKEQVITTAPAEAMPVESIEPVGNSETQSVTKPNMHNNSYEQQAQMIQERQTRRNEAQQLSSTE